MKIIRWFFGWSSKKQTLAEIQQENTLAEIKRLAQAWGYSVENEIFLVEPEKFALRYETTKINHHGLSCYPALVDRITDLRYQLTGMGVRPMVQYLHLHRNGSNSASLEAGHAFGTFLLATGNTDLARTFISQLEEGLGLELARRAVNQAFYDAAAAVDESIAYGLMELTTEDYTDGECDTQYPDEVTSSE